MRRYRYASKWLVASGLSLAAASTFSQGAPISVFPTRVTLAGRTTSASVQLKNESGADSRFEASVHAWSMSESGEMQLAPAPDLVAFPTVFALKPGESRSIRVGTSTRAERTELSFRLIVQELAHTAEASSAPGVQMLRRLSIPIFVTPADRQLKAELHNLSVVKPGVVAMWLRNLGTVHFMAAEMILEGRDASGTTVVKAQRDGWYVLPGNDIRYEIEFDPAACTRLSRITATVLLRDVKVPPLVETATVEPSLCGPR